MPGRQSTTSSIDEWAERLPDAYLTCRDMGHTWRPFRAEWHPEENAYWRSLRCSRCRTERAQWISSTGHIAHGNAYTYPEGYTAPPGAGRMDGGGRDAIRLHSVLRTIEKSESKAS